MFDANLQEFVQRVSYICNLQTGGKRSSEDACEKIKGLWKDLERSKDELGLS